MTPRERPFARRRQALGLGIEQAAVRLRVSARHLRALELGRAPLTQPLAARMAVEYGTSLSELTRPAG